MPVTPLVLYEDNHLLVVNKPAGLPTMGVAAGATSLLTVAKEYIADKYQKSGNVYLGIVSRLDAPVTGIVVIARTSKAAGRLSEQFRQGTVTKIYQAIVQPAGDLTAEPAAGQGGAWIECRDWLRKHERHRKVLTVPATAAGAQEAILRYRVLARSGARGHVEVQLLTGRKHQIRVQLSARGMPILGDRKYGSVCPFPTGIALHATKLTLLHPTRKEPLTFVCPPPRCWQRFLAYDDTDEQG